MLTSTFVLLLVSIFSDLTCLSEDLCQLCKYFGRDLMWFDPVY